mmetsp:Transcript_68695/g.161595  ORF Transcript_68695/g.161595 Transcript_68695/m.161595 type:complete len:532 (-) Transcript_68695:32-1627(-)
MVLESCCCQREAEVPAEVIGASVPQAPREAEVAQDELTFPDVLLEASSVDDPQRKMTESRHMEVESEILRGVALHKVLRNPEFWMTPDRIRQTQRAEQVWDRSTPVEFYDTFLSHTWRTPGRWKVLALLLQSGWVHGFVGWCIGVSLALVLKVLHLVPVTWTVPMLVATTQYAVQISPVTIIFSGVFLVAGCGFSVLLPFRTQMCFLDVACIHQGGGALFRRGLYGLGGCLSVSKELRVLYSPPYLQSLWCVFELVGFRKANPSGKLTFAPLFVERCAVMMLLVSWCILLVLMYVVSRRDDTSGQQTHALWYTVIILPFFTVAVHALRLNYREKRQLVSELEHFDFDTARCSLDFDRAFILSAVEGWFGSKEGFEDFVRGPLREELLSLIPVGHFPHRYMAMFVSSAIAWTLDSSLSLYISGADGQGLLFYTVSYLAGCVCSVPNVAHSILYLSDRSSERGQSLMLDWLKSLAVLLSVLLWSLLCLWTWTVVARSDSLLGLAGYMAFCGLQLCWDLGAVQSCRAFFLGKVG